MNVTVNHFFESWKKSVLDAVKNDENIKSENLSDSIILVNYLTYIRKCIPYPVKIVESPEILDTIPGELKESYDQIKKRLTTGQGVAPYLSNKAKNLVFDGLFLDWNILHLHLGMIDSNGHVSRTGTTLHLTINDGTVYFIKLGHHGPTAYTDVSELKTIYKNWPSLLNVVGVTLDQGVTENDRFDLRKHGVIQITTFDDENGTSVSVIPKRALYSTAKTSMYDQELLDISIPNLIKSIIELGRKELHEDFPSDAEFVYFPKEHRFIFGILDSERQFVKIFFGIDSLSFWRHIFTNYKEIIIFPNHQTK